MWNKTELSPVGQCRLSVRNPKNNKKYSVEFTVVEQNLISVHDCNFDRVVSVSTIDKYADIFDEKLGTLPGEVHIRTDDQVHPVPIYMRQRLKAELDRMTKEGVIAPVDQPTPWLSQLVLAEKKSGKLRVCIDPRELNKALQREHYIMPILEDTLHELRDSRVFSKADLSQGYWHIKLDDESSYLTTFQTCFGRYRWLRLPFGTNVSAEIFQKKLLEALEGLPGVICIADDIVIHGKKVTDHDENLEKFLARCKDRGIKLNKAKLELRLSEITFMGHLITSEGLQSDPEKVQAVRDMVPPQNLEELRRYLGLVNYLAKFLPNLTDVITPLRNLTRKNVSWMWSKAQQTAFDEMKNLVTSAPVLAMYDPTKELTLENDASEYGLGSALMQGKPVAYASRSMTDTERRWAQIEKELLAVIYGLEKFHHYTYGRHVTVVTDHQPLVSIVSKPLSKAPKRLQSLLLRAQKYNITLVYKPGKSIPVADTLSRAPLPHKPDSEEISVNYISFLPVKSPCLDTIRDETLKDETLIELKTTIISGWPVSKVNLPAKLTPYYDYRDELSVQDGVILRGERIVIPRAVQPEMKRRIHSGHLGINSCLRRARELLFWPGMSGDIKRHVESCDVCSTYCDKQSPETIYMHPVPDRQWAKVGTDLFQIEDRDYLVTVDYYSSFFEVDYLPDTSSETVISKLKQHFARYGTPDVVVSDGGPQYTSGKFQKFSSLWGFSHQRSSPGNSKANGAAEAAVKTAKRLMRKCRASNEDPYLGLLNLRNTPTEELLTSPTQRLLGRKTKTPLPITASALKPMHQEPDKCRQEGKKAIFAHRLNQRRRDLKPLKVGECVRMQPIQAGSKQWKQATVAKQVKTRTYEVVTDNGRRYTRNRQYLRSSVPSRDPVTEPDVYVERQKSPSRDQVYRSPPVQERPPSPDQARRAPLAAGTETAVSAPPKEAPKPPSDGLYRTRSGRSIKPVKPFNL